MNRRQYLGQHMLTSRDVAQRMVDAAGISPGESVLEIGTGAGALTGLLCQRARRVVSFERDPEMHRGARRRLKQENLELVCGDGFCDMPFDVLVSSLPYSRSRDAIEWMCQRRFSRAVIMVQKEFAAKLESGGRAVSAIASHCFDIERVMDVGRGSFEPAPEVDSAVLRMAQRRVLEKEVVQAVNLLFSHRRKAVSTVARRFGIESGETRRLEELDPGGIVDLGRQVAGR